jgi:hypothetical protein
MASLMKGNRSEVWYEWYVETNFKNGDGEWEIEDHHHSDKLRPLMKSYRDELRDFFDGKLALVLVRNVGNPDDGVTGRSWAYVTDMLTELPENFENGDANAPVPKRFRKEFDEIFG